MSESRQTRRHFSVFDYTITLTRKHRYLVVSSPEFGIQIASNYVDLDNLSSEEIGMSVLQLIRQMDVRLNQMQLRGETAPKPLRARGVNALLDREYLSSREAAKVLGVSTATLRKMVKSGAVHAEKTPGGHLRFAVDALAHSHAPATTSEAAAFSPFENITLEPRNEPASSGMNDKRIA
jgi:excisionase family DNA binding protein